MIKVSMDEWMDGWKDGLKDGWKGRWEPTLVEGILFPLTPGRFFLTAFLKVFVRLSLESPKSSISSLNSLFS